MTAAKDSVDGKVVATAGAPATQCPDVDAAVYAELDRAIAKFPTWPTDALHALGVLGEEFGELTKEVLQLTYEPHKSSLADVRKEAVQTAAMALRFVRSLDRYEYKRGGQHSQGPVTTKARTLGAESAGTGDDTRETKEGQP